MTVPEAIAWAESMYEKWMTFSSGDQRIDHAVQIGYLTMVKELKKFEQNEHR